VVDWSNDTLSNEHRAVQVVRNAMAKRQETKKKNTEYIIQDIVHPNRNRRRFRTAGQIGFFGVRTVTAVRFQIEERRVETECAERAFERSVSIH
jgi:hypothetical protein